MRKRKNSTCKKPQKPQQPYDFFKTKTFEEICIFVFLAGILINIHSIFLLDHTIGWNMTKGAIIIAISFVLCWALLSLTRITFDKNIALSFSGASFILWTFLALNFYLADWAQDPIVIRPEIVNVEHYPRSRHKERGCHIDVKIGDTVKRIDYKGKKFEQLQKLTTYQIEVHNGLFDIQVFDDPDSLK